MQSDRSLKPAAVIAAALCTSILIYLLIMVQMRRMEPSLLFKPDRRRPAVAEAGISGLQTVSIRTADHLALASWFLPASPGRPTILYFHGNGGNLSNRIGRARRFAARGYGLLLVEYRGYGGNAGTPSEAGFDQDALAAAAFLDMCGINPRTTVLFGESLGTAVAVELATRRPYAAVILDSPFTSIAAVAQRRYPLLPVGYLIRNRFDLVSRIMHVAAPLLVIQGQGDTIIPPAMGRAVYAAARDPKQIWTAPRGSHSNLLDVGGDAVVAGFINRFVKQP